MYNAQTFLRWFDRYEGLGYNPAIKVWRYKVWIGRITNAFYKSAP